VLCYQAPSALNDQIPLPGFNREKRQGIEKDHSMLKTFCRFAADFEAGGFARQLVF
jgi:hypothetical protein